MSKAHRVACFLLAFAVVSAMVLGGAAPGGSMVGVASAGSFGFQDCDISDSLISAIIRSFTSPNGDECRFNPEDGSTQLEAWEDVRTAGEFTEIYDTQSENVGDGLRSVAWSKAKIAVVEALNNGSSATVAMQEANATVEEYYSSHQRNYIARWNAQFLTLNNSRDHISFRIQGQSNENDTIDAVGKKDVMLQNGSTVEAWYMTYYRQSGGSSGSDNLEAQPIGPTVQYTNDVPNTTEPINQTAYGQTDFPSTAGLWADNATKAGTTYENVVMQANVSHGFWKYDQQANQVKANLVPYINDVYANYTAGQLNTSDIIDPVTLAGQASSDYNSTGYYSFAAAELAAMGAGGNVSHSHTVTFPAPNGTVYNGSLFYTGNDKANVSVNETVDPSTYNGSFYLATSSDGYLHLDENFTVEDAIDTRTGQEVNTTSFERYLRHTTSASDLENDLNRIRELEDDYESTSAPGGGGGSSSGSQTLVIVVLAAALGAAAMGRGRNGGGRRRRR